MIDSLNIFNKLENALQSRLVIYFLFCIIFFSLYYQSLFQSPRADVMMYLFQTAAIHHDYWLLLKQAVIFNHLEKDPLLFRPILYFILATEDFIFKYNFKWWQALNIFFHISVVYFLFQYLRLLCKEVKPILIFLLAILAGALYAGSEMVFWPEVGGYLIFCSAMLASQSILQKWINDHYDINRKTIFLLFCGDAIAIFSYELGFFLIIIHIVYLLWVRLCHVDNIVRIRHVNAAISGLVALLLIYSCLGLMNALSEMGSFEAVITNLYALQHHASISSNTFFEGLFKTLSFWVGSIIDPFSMKLLAGSRIVSNMPDSFKYFSMLLISIGIIIGIQSIRYLFFSRTEDNRLKYAFFSALLLMLFYLLLISLGRTQQRGLIYVLENNTYYPYIFSKLLIVLLFISLRQYWLNFVYAGICVLVIMLYCNIIRLEKIQFQQLRYHSLSRIRLIHVANQLIKSNGNHTTFYIKNCSQNAPVEWIVRTKMIDKDMPFKSVPTEFKLLYPFNYVSTNYDYLISCEKNKILINSTKGFSRRRMNDETV